MITHVLKPAPPHPFTHHLRPCGISSVRCAVVMDKNEEQSQVSNAGLSALVSRTIAESVWPAPEIN